VRKFSGALNRLVVPGSSYRASHWAFLQFLRMPPKGENRPNDTILAEFLWFPLGQLIALRSSRRIAKGAGMYPPRQLGELAPRRRFVVIGMKDD
jgi:hypothetical protein